MCIVALAINQHPDYPLVCLANRDEFHNRPTAPMQWWPDGQTLAGIDLQSHGTWMGLHQSGRFSLLTNVRNPDLHGQPEAPSRGIIVSDYLQKGVLPSAETRKQMAGYNLVSADLIKGEFRFHTNQTEKLQSIEESNLIDLDHGVCCLSNGNLNTPWPKCLKLGLGLQNALRSDGNMSSEHLFSLLADQTLAPDEELPSTGVPYEWEKMLSAVKIVSPAYGTRSSTVLTLTRDRSVYIEERTFNPDGSKASTNSFEFVLGQNQT